MLHLVKFMNMLNLESNIAENFISFTFYQKFVVQQLKEDK